MYVYLVTALIGLGGALFGYDIGIISGILALDSFKSAFHIDDWNNHLLEQGLIVSTFVIGNLIGAGLFASRLADTCGRKRTLVGASFVFVCASTLQIFACNLLMLYVGRTICGLAIGVLTMIVPLFISELAPKNIRGRLISFNQISMTGGILVAFWTAYALKDMSNGWRWAFAGQIFPALIILIFSPFLPESPRWLVNVGRKEEARRNLFQLRGEKNKEETEKEMAEMIATIQHEQAMEEDTWTFLFTDPTSKRRLLLLCILQAGQQLTGINVIMYYMPFVAQSVGFGGSDHGLLAQGVNGVVNFLSTFVAFFFVDRFGRRLSLIAGGELWSWSSVDVFILVIVFLSFFKFSFFSFLFFSFSLFAHAFSQPLFPSLPSLPLHPPPPPSLPLSSLIQVFSCLFLWVY